MRLDEAVEKAVAELNQMFSDPQKGLKALAGDYTDCSYEQWLWVERAYDWLLPHFLYDVGLMIDFLRDFSL